MIKTLYKLILCLFITTLTLTSCSVGEESIVSSNFSEDEISQSASKDFDILQTVEESSQKPENFEPEFEESSQVLDDATDISNTSQEKEESTEDFESSDVDDNSKEVFETSENNSENVSVEDSNVETSITSPEDKTILYGTAIISCSVEAYEVVDGYFDTTSITDKMKECFDSPEYDDAYYYVGFDPRCYSGDVDIASYYKRFGIEYEYYEGVYFAYVTENQIKDMISENDYEERLIPYTRLRWIGEGEKERFIAEMEAMLNLPA